MRNHTEITYVLDRSGSMASIQEDVVGGLKEFIKEQKKGGDNASFTLVQFDTGSTDYLYNSQPIKYVSEEVEFKPRGGTPLLDAIGSAITRTGDRLRKMPETRRPDKVVFVIHTDGQENSSKEYTASKIKEMIQHQQEKYNWQFIFMSSDLNAVNDAFQNYNIPWANAVYMDQHNHTASATLTGQHVNSYRSTNDVDTIAYASAERKKLAKK